MAQTGVLVSLAVTCTLWTAAGGLTQPPSPDVVKLGFCWTPGLKATVTHSSARTQSGAPTRTSTFQYTMSVLKDGPNLRVKLKNPVADLSAAGGPVTAEVQARVDEQLQELLPDFLVTPRGKLVGFVDAAAHQARLRAMIDKGLPKNVDRAAAQKAIDVATSEATLNARLAEQWQTLVGNWLGTTVPVGVEQTRQTRLGSAKKPASITHRFGAVGRLPCRRGGKDRQCLQLDLHSVPDEAATNARVGQILEALGQTLPPTTRVKSAAVVETVQLVAEATCLVPHSITRTQTQTLVIDQGASESSVTRSDRSVVTYAYE